MGHKLSPFPHYLLLTGMEASTFNSGIFILNSSKRSLVIFQTVLILVHVSMVFRDMYWGSNSLRFLITYY